MPLLLVWHLRPRDLRTAVAAMAAVAVLIGSPGYRDNLEIPLAYTAVGMFLALIVWMQLESAPRSWRSWLIIVFPPLTAAALLCRTARRNVINWRWPIAASTFAAWSVAGSNWRL